jgi:hypothetical protein
MSFMLLWIGIVVEEKRFHGRRLTRKRLVDAGCHEVVATASRNG